MIYYFAYCSVKSGPQSLSVNWIIRPAKLKPVPAASFPFRSWRWQGWGCGGRECLYTQILKLNNRLYTFKRGISLENGNTNLGYSFPSFLNILISVKDTITTAQNWNLNDGSAVVNFNQCYHHLVWICPNTLGYYFYRNQPVKYLSPFSIPNFSHGIAPSLQTDFGST